MDQIGLTSWPVSHLYGIEGCGLQSDALPDDLYLLYDIVDKVGNGHRI